VIHVGDFFRFHYFEDHARHRDIALLGGLHRRAETDFRIVNRVGQEIDENPSWMLDMLGRPPNRGLSGALVELVL
jgi:hypothetical protein